VAAVALALLACGDDDGGTVAAPTSTTAVGSPTVTSAPPTTAAPTTTATTVPPATTTTAPVWVVGASTLPLRPDGFGEIQPTPPVLVNRSLPTVDVLPPPASGGFESTIAPISDEVRARMGGTWFDGCPVGLDDLRYVTVSFRGFDGDAHTGELIVNASEAEGVVGVFHQLFDAGFPIEEMRIVTDADLAAPPTGDGNNTAAFVCRPVRRGRRFSAHASGLAIDLDPFQNPYTTDDIVVPELASAYLDRSDVRPGMILDGDVAVEAFAAIGWDWGGRWDDPVDRMHFTATGG
jgi:hypothetical protein